MLKVFRGGFSLAGFIWKEEDMLKRLRVHLSLAGLIVLLLFPILGVAAPVNLNTWTAESYPAVSGFGAGVWTVSPSGDTVTQSVNGQPTLFYSDFNALGTDVRGQIRVSSSDGDDDFIGFALGFQPGDTSNGAANYLLVDWKQGTQSFDFGVPSTTPRTTALAGLAVSRVTGVPTADEFWGHTNFASHAGGGLMELARANTLGSSGYDDDVTYEFRFVFQPTSLQVSVDGVLELDITGSFADGRLAFYNFSQAAVTYSAFSVDPAPMAPIPEPSTALLLVTGLIGIAVHVRRHRPNTTSQVARENRGQRRKPSVSC